MSNKWQARAVKIAKKSTYKERFRHGAVLVKGGSVIQEGFNSFNYSSFYHRFSEWGIEHAEASALHQVSKSKTTGAVLYVVRINKEGYTRYSKPCLSCIKLAQFCGVRKIVYSITETLFGEIKL